MEPVVPCTLSPFSRNNRRLPPANPSNPAAAVDSPLEVHRFSQINLARPSRNQRRLIVAIHRFRRYTQIKDPKATIAARGPWVPLVEFAAARLTSLRRCEPPNSSAIFRCSGDVPIAGESCLRRRGRRRYRVPSSISDPSIKTTPSLSLKTSCVFDGLRGSKSSRKNNILTDCITDGFDKSVKLRAMWIKKR